MTLHLLSLLSFTAILAISAAAPYDDQTALSDSVMVALHKFLGEEQSADSQQLCEEEGYDVTLKGITYQFYHCANSAFNMFCYDTSKNLPRDCPSGFGGKGCYTINWQTSFNTYTFKICNFFDRHCMTSWSPRLSGNCDRRQQAQVAKVTAQLTLCEELPDGTEDCKSIPDREQAVQKQQYNDCFCITTPDGESVCEGNCN